MNTQIGFDAPLPKARLQWPVLVLVAALLLPLAAPNQYWLHLFIITLVWAQLASALNIVLGYRGVLCLVNSAFIGVGGYASALLAVRFGVSPWLGLLAAVVCAAAAGLLVGIVVMRMPIDALIIATLAFRTVFQIVAVNWVEITNGPMGLSGIPALPLRIPGLIDAGPLCLQGFYYLALFLVVVTSFIVSRLARSPFGRAWVALRENVDLARSLGVNRFGFDLLAITISAGLTGLGGSLYAHYVTIVAPELLGFTYMSVMTTIVVAGGRGTIPGPILGALFFTLLPELLRATSEFRMLIYGVVIMLTILLMPGGMARLPQQVANWRRGLRKREVA